MVATGTVSGCQASREAEEAEQSAQELQRQVEEAEGQLDETRDRAEVIRRDFEGARDAGEGSFEEFVKGAGAIAGASSQLVQALANADKLHAALEVDRYGYELLAEGDNDTKREVVRACNRAFLGLSRAQKENVEVVADGLHGRKWGQLTPDEKFRVAPYTALLPCVTKGLAKRAPKTP